MIDVTLSADKSSSLSIGLVLLLRVVAFANGRVASERDLLLVIIHTDDDVTQLSIC